MTYKVGTQPLVNTVELNKDIEAFEQVLPIDSTMNKKFEGVSRLVMLDRYAFKDTEHKTLKAGDFVVLTVREDPKFPARGTGFVQTIDFENGTAYVRVDEEFQAMSDVVDEHGIMEVAIKGLDKPLEIFYEQIAYRNARAMAAVEKTKKAQEIWFEKFHEILLNIDYVPAGRILYGAGLDAAVTFFNCYVMPFFKDSRKGINEHREKVMEIMSRGGGVGSNGSTLRPRGALAKGVNGRSSGAVSWLNDVSSLTNLVEQGGSRRGAQMIMLIDNHPDIVEFIISKVQNPRILQYLIESSEDALIVKEAKRKLKFIPLTQNQKATFEAITQLKEDQALELFGAEVVNEAKEKLQVGGTYDVHNPNYLEGANISVCITKEFMAAIEEDTLYDLKFPDIDNYNEADKRAYDEKWHEVGDVRRWSEMGYGVKVYHRIKATALWDLINVCATTAAEPGIFFYDNANDMTNASAYGQFAVATNPCGEQPLSPFSVCNLGAINIKNFVKENGEFDYEKFKYVISIAVRFQDNVIEATPYFLEENKKQAQGERRTGLGVMALADGLIKMKLRYGSTLGNEAIDKIFETLATASYRASVELAKEKGSFPFLDVLPNGEKNENGREKFINTGFMKKMPEDIRNDVLTYGIRNSHLNTIAPTGSTGTMANVSTGLEPYFAFSYYRSGRLGTNIEVNAAIVDEFLLKNPEYTVSTLPDYFVSSMELTPEEHVDVQCTIQRWIDSSISKTVNAPKGYQVDQVKRVYERLHKGGAKGGTVYVDGSRDSQVLTLKSEEKKPKQIKFEFAGSEEVKKPILLETIPELTSTNVKVGNELGDTCPVCLEGTVRKSGGCHTCDRCNAQLQCGL